MPTKKRPPAIKALYREARLKEMEARSAKFDLLERCGWIRFADGVWLDPETAPRYQVGSGLRGYDTTDHAFAALCYELERDKKV